MADINEVVQDLNEHGKGRGICIGCEEEMPGGGLCEACEEKMRMIDRAIGGGEWEQGAGGWATR